MHIEGYTAAIGSGYSVADAELIGPELTRLAERGLSTTEDIARAAEASTSLLHQFVFPYDDVEAARRHRLSLAGHLARSIQVTLTDETGERRTMRAFYPVRLDPNSGETSKEKRLYIPITVIAGNADLAGQVRADLWRQLVMWRAKVRDFEESFQAIVDAIDATKTDMETAAA